MLQQTRYKIAEKVKANLFDRALKDPSTVTSEMARSAIMLLCKNQSVLAPERNALHILEQYIEHHSKFCGKSKDLGVIHVDALRRLDAKRAGDAFVLEMLNGLDLEASRSKSIEMCPFTRESLQQLHRPQATLGLPEIVGFDFDPFLFTQQTNGRPLSSLAYKILVSENLIIDLRLDDDKLKRYLSMIENGYHDVPYHNSIHAADVLQRVHTIIKTVGENVFDKIDRLALYLAAVVHDHGHAGVTNNFLIASAHPLARQYNDKSPWENYHVASALEPLITMDDVKFMEAMTLSEKTHMRRVIVDLVLATDMSRHVELMRAISGRATTIGGIRDCELPLREALCLALKCADIGHTTCRFDQHEKWVRRLQEELYNQGDLEKESGLPISAMADRTNPALSIQTSQLAFYDAVVLPMMNLLTVFFTGAQPLLEHACKNREVYANIGDFTVNPDYQ